MSELRGNPSVQKFAENYRCLEMPATTNTTEYRLGTGLIELICVTANDLEYIVNEKSAKLPQDTWIWAVGAIKVRQNGIHSGTQVYYRFI